MDWIIELFRYMTWADRCVWKSIQAFPQAEDHPELKERLYHIHATQHAFYQIWQESEVNLPGVSAFNSIPDLIQWAQAYHDKIFNYLQKVDPAILNNAIDIPWNKQIEKRIGSIPQSCTLQQSIQQVILHSSYHQGQINHVLRKIGGNPEPLDFILWVMKGKPLA